MANSSKPDERAGWEHIWRSGNIPPRYRSLAVPNATVVQLADSLSPNSFVLDVGCGVGRHLIYLGKRGFRVAGMDISPSSIKMSQEVCAEHQIPFEGHVSNMTTMPWPDMTFDAALSTSTIHHNLRADIAQTLSEIRRVLKVGGLLLADFPCTDSLDYQQMRDKVKAGELVAVEPNTFVDQRPQVDEMDDLFLPHHYCDEADLRDLLKAFEVISVKAVLREIALENMTGMQGKWVAWARKIA